MATVLDGFGCPRVLINSVDDHVHVLFELGRTVAISSVVEEVKTTSSRWLKTQGEEFAAFRWQAGYGAFAVSASNVLAVREYIAGQREHHKMQSFPDEYRTVAEQHGVALDEKHAWD
jgi:putative transposase